MKSKYIYFDNAASTFPKPHSVIKAADKFIKHEAANPGRGAHRLSLKSSERIYSVREKIAAHLDFPSPERVILTSGATAALSFAIKSGVPDGSHVILSDVEHNATLRAVHALSRTRGVIYSFYDTLDPEVSIRRELRPDTTHLITTLASNVDGRRVDISLLSKISSEFGLKLILDASQLLGHEALSLKDVTFDALAGAGHKALFGYTGIGFLVLGTAELRPTLTEGGSGSYSKDLEMPHLPPERYEAGTLPTVSAVSLGAGIDFIEKTGVSVIKNKLERMTDDLKTILSSHRGIDLCVGYGGLVSFTARDIASEELASRLDRLGFATRGGFHCAPLAHKKLGTYNNGTVRISLSYLNNQSELERFDRALYYALK